MMAVFCDRFSLVLFISIILVFLSSISALSATGSTDHQTKLVLGEENLGPWKNEVMGAALAPGPVADAPEGTLVLAENRTKRPDILRRFRPYRDGWDIANRHYWASVGFTGAAGFILAILWFISFGLALLIHLCCGWKINIKDKGSYHSQRICLILLLTFTCAAARLSLIAVAAVMLLLALIGLFLSILCHQHAILIFVISGWLLVAMTFILCGVFMILNNAISDTCMAMGEWVQNPHAESALSNILPCVDQRTTNKTLYQSKQVVTNIVNIVDQYIYTIANTDPPEGNMNYYNQSGPTMPALCYPFDNQLQPRQCTSQEVSSTNASLVWEKYECEVNEANICTTVGRVTPEIYSQLVAAANESYALEHYTPLLLSLQDCNFVQDTFREIASSYCPPLNHYLKIVNAGLGLISVGVLLCLVLWILYANRPQREEVFVKLSLSTKLKNRFIKTGNNTNSSLSNSASEV